MGGSSNRPFRGARSISLHNGDDAGNGNAPSVPYFPLRGVVEGFYGTFYTFAERNALIRFLGEQGFNLYVYGPKNDRCHRARWREPYPEQAMERFAETVELAQEAGVSFCYTISPAETICFTDGADFAALTAKLEAFYEMGTRAFGLLFDDIVPVLRDPADRMRFATPAHAHADLANRLYGWLQQLDPACTLTCCPVEYAGVAPFPEGVHTLGRILHPEIGLFYTGPATCSESITRADVEAFAAAARRAPILWDNYPVNDLEMGPELHMGPLRGREASLYRVTKGYVANLMLQPKASRIPLLTTAAYLAAPHRYDPAIAWEEALRAVAGAESVEALRLFAENSLFSALDSRAPEPLTTLTEEALGSLLQGETATESAAVQALDDYLSQVNEACYYLKYFLADLELRHDLLPWLELLDFWQDMARHGIDVLRGLEQGKETTRSRRIAEEWRQLVVRHPRRIAGNVLLPLVDYILEIAAPKPTTEGPPATILMEKGAT